MFGRLPAGHPFECFAHGKELLDVGERELHHANSGMRDAFKQATPFQGADGFTERTTAHAEGVGQLLFAKPAACGEFAAHDQCFETGDGVVDHDAAGKQGFV